MQLLSSSPIFTGIPDSTPPPPGGSFAIRYFRLSNLQALIESDFTEEGGLDRAVELVSAGGGIAKSRDLARSQAEQVNRASETKDHLRSHSITSLPLWPQYQIISKVSVF